MQTIVFAARPRLPRAYAGEGAARGGGRFEVLAARPGGAAAAGPAQPKVNA